MGFHNVVAANGFSVALTGMAIVFAGLILVSLFIAAIPRVLGRGESRVRDMARRGAAWRAEHAARAAGAVSRGPTSAGGTIDGSATADKLPGELRAAIAYVLVAERERELALDRQHITLREGEEQRVWTAIGKMRTLATRL